MSRSNTPVEKIQLQVRQAIESTKACEVVMIQSRAGDVRVAFRVHDMPRWLRMLSSYLAREDKEKWHSFVGEKYILHNGKLAKVWVWMIDAPEGTSLNVAAQAACLCMTGSVSRSEEAEGELLSANPVSIPAGWAIGKEAVSRISMTRGGDV